MVTTRLDCSEVQRGPSAGAPMASRAGVGRTAGHLGRFGEEAEVLLADGGAARLAAIVDHCRVRRYTRSGDPGTKFGRSLEIAFLGPFQVRVGGGSLEQPPPKEAVVLGVLALRASRPVPVVELEAVLWGDDPPRSSAKVVQTYISRWRQRLGSSLIDRTSSGYRLLVEDDAVDALRFVRHAEAGQRALRASDSDAARVHLTAALALWRGEIPSELGLHLAGRAGLAPLEELRRSAEEAMAEVWLASGEHDEHIGDLERAALAQPLRERRWEQLIVGLHRCGRQAEALRAAQQARRCLGEVGLDVGPRLVSLEAAIARGDFATTDPDGSTTRSVRAGAPHTPPVIEPMRAAHNLPAPRGDLIGREDALVEVMAAVTRERLVTLIGFGGIGKTSLAVAAAQRLAHRFTDGVWFVDLVPVFDLAGLVESVAGTVGLQLGEHGSSLRAFVHAIDRLDALFVLDNAEHVTDVVATFVDEVTEGAHRPRVLVTSREPLDLGNERSVRVRGLEIGNDLRSPALAVLAIAAERAGARLDERDAPLAARICHALDGSPLALELAGAQLRQLTIGELAERLDQRLELLQRSPRGRRRRQASLASVLSDTWAMLDGTQQELLRQLAAFPASFDAAGVEGVCGESDVPLVGPALAGLVARSLVVNSGDGRLRLLETVKLFGRNRWAEAADPEVFEAKHTAWVLGHLRSFPRHSRHTSLVFAGWIVRHYDDVRTVEQRLMTADRIEELVDLLGMQAETHLQGLAARSLAVIERIDLLISSGRCSPAQQGKLLLTASAAGLGAWRPDWIARSAEAVVHLRRSLAAEDEPGTRTDLAAALVIDSWLVALRDVAAAIGRLEEAIALVDEFAPALANIALLYWSNHLMVAGRPEEARAPLRRLAERIEPGVADVASNLLLQHEGLLLFATSPAEALSSFTTAREQLLGAGMSWTGSWLVMDAVLVANTGDVERTVSLLVQTRDDARRNGHDGLPDILLPIAVIAWRLGDIERARTLITAMRFAGRSTQAFPITHCYREVRRAIGRAPRNPLDDESLEQVFEQAFLWLQR